MQRIQSKKKKKHNKWKTMSIVKWPYLRKGRLILGNGKKRYIKSGRLTLRNRRSQKGEFLPVAAALAPLVAPLSGKLFGDHKKQRARNIILIEKQHE